MIETYFKAAREGEFKKIEDFRVGSWIYVKEATQEDLAKISEVTGLDLADIRDSLDKYELPRIEHISDNAIIFIRHPAETEFGLYTETLTMILTHNFFIAISPSRSEIVENLLGSNNALGTPQKTKLLLHILTKINQAYTISIKRVRYAILEHEQSRKIIDSSSIMLLTKNEEILNQYLTALVPMYNVFVSIADGRYLQFQEEDIDLLEDLMIAIRQSEDICRVNVKSIRSLRDSYQIIFTNDVNRTIKLLTALTVIFTVPTITASFYGMNVPLPFQSHLHAFWIVVGVTFIATVLAIYLFLRNRWL